MNKKALSLAVCLAMALPTASNALSLGDIESDSSLNQPFKGTINLLSTSVKEASSLRVKVASPAVFNRVGIDRPAFLNSIRFRTAVKNGRPVILVSSSQPINEPFLNFLLEVRWPNGQLLKEYTVLLDPPVLMQADTAIASNAAGVRKEPGVQAPVYRDISQPVQTVRQQPRKVVKAAAAPKRQSRLRRPGPPRTASASRSRVRNYRVRRGDTLYKVARKLGYKGVRNEQMMVALYNKNKRAFTLRNMNNLKAGALLSRPSYQEAKSISARKAKSQVIAQARAWKQKRAGLIAKKATQNNRVVASAAQPKQAHVEVMGGNKSIGANAVAGASGSGSSSVDELRKQLALTNEALTTRLKENEELKSRVAELESLLRKKNKLITLKSEQLAILQEKMGGNANAGSSQQMGASQPNPVIRNNTIDQSDGTDIQQAAVTEEANRAGTIIRTDPGQNAIRTEVPPLVNEPATVNTTTESNNSANNASGEDDSLDIMGLLGSPAAMGVGGGTLLALLGGLWFMRRRKDDDEYQDFSSIDIDNQMDETPFDDSALSDISDINDELTEEPDFGSIDDSVDMGSTAPQKGSANPSEQEDILQEADVYIVYGLHDQAEAELKRAIDADPTNLAYRVKLLENYKAANNAEAFEDEAKAFMDLDVEGKDAYLDDITDWGNKLIPGNKLFENKDSLKSVAAGAAGAAAAGVAMVAGTALAENNNIDDDVTDNLEDLMADNEMPEIDDRMDTSLDDLDLDEIMNEESVDDLDALVDDFNFDDLDVSGEEISDEDFDLEMASTEKLLDSVKEDEANEANDEELNLLDSDDLESEFNLDAADLSEVKTEGKDDLDIANLNLNLDSNDFNKIMPQDNAYKKQEVSADSLDIGSFKTDSPEIDSLDINGLETKNLAVDDDTIDVNLKADNQEENLLADFDDNLSFLDLDDDSEIIGETQIETKLDLARAYIDMGDIEGARSTLEEVLLEGSDEQKKEAEDLLHQTG